MTKGLPMRIVAILAYDPQKNEISLQYHVAFTLQEMEGAS